MTVLAKALLLPEMSGKQSFLTCSLRQQLQRYEDFAARGSLSLLS